jgi:type I restriction enzyme, S subunit
VSTAVAVGSLGSVVDLNPALPMALTANTAVAFVPMSAASAEAAVAVGSEERSYADVAKGYTPMLNGDILVAKITPCFENGKVVQATLNHPVGFGSTEFHVLRPNVEQVEPRYLLHFLRQPWVRQAGERRMTGSAGQRRVPEQFLAELQVPLPPLPEQRRIAAILDKAGDLRAKRRAALERLNGLMRAVFLEMFGDPRAKPSQWAVRSLGSLFTIRHGFAFKSDYFVDCGKFALLTPGNFHETGGFRDRGAKQKYYDGPIPSDYVLMPSDLLIAMTEQAPGLLGSPLFVPESTTFLHNQRLGLVEPRDGVEKWFLFHLFNSPFVRSEIQASATGTKVKHTSPAKVMALRLPIPPVELQNEFARRANAAEHLHIRQHASETALNRLFSSLQDRAFAGEL